MDEISSFPETRARQASRPRALLLAAAACAVTALAAAPLSPLVDDANIVVLFLFTVLLVALRLGRAPAVLASVLGVLLFDVFFVPPRFTLAVADAQYLITFAVMLLTGLVTAHLAAGLREQAREAARRERRMQGMYQLASELSGALTVEQLAGIVGRFLQAHAHAACAILLPDASGTRFTSVGEAAALAPESRLARLALGSGKPIPDSTEGRAGERPLYYPLRAATRNVGVLVVRLEAHADGSPEDAAPVLDTLAALVAVALERMHFAEAARASEMNALTERLRSSILSALSHDLRTPLTAMVGLADSLFLVNPPLPAPALEAARALHEQATRLGGMVGNLLDMARLNAGELRLRREWQPLEEVVGTSLKLLGAALADRPLDIRLTADLPLLEFDATLIERVLFNLLENAAKYSPPGSTIELSAAVKDDAVEIAVADRCAGLPQDGSEELFAMFRRGAAQTGRDGTGLGLAISRAIVEAHGGRISAANRPGGGACFRFTLPAGKPPSVEAESA